MIKDLMEPCLKFDHFLRPTFADILKTIAKIKIQYFGFDSNLN